MKFTLSWLKEHLDTQASLNDISKTLTMIGLEVESIYDRAAALAPFTVAKILHAEKHPEADKLRVCKVQSDIGELQIVCGAPNARAGIYVALAKEGAVIPANSMVIKKTKIRGVESCGMLCSATELALGSDSDGIIELPEAPIGESIVKALGLDDPVIEIAVTPNRADCLGVRGIARDLAAAGLGTLLPLARAGEGRGEGGFSSPISVTLSDTRKCPQFIGCTVRGVKNGPSPDWLRKRLEAIGQKSISALVDITNYLTFDHGRPLHVFDAKKLIGHLTVRDAKGGERLKALNGKEYALSAGMTVIADEAGPQSLGGVIGGEATGCTESTTEIFLEAAYFAPAPIAATGRALQIDSDARYRFERGVDPAFVETGAKLAVALILKLCGGEASEFVYAGQTPEWKRSIAFRPERVASLGGVAISADDALRILTSLGFTGHAFLTPPSWRGDVEGEADLIEEILRIHGYDNIPSTPLPAPIGIARPAINIAQKRAYLARRLLASRGMLECRTWSFLPEAQAKQFGLSNPKLKLLNPISADLDTMRPSLLPNLLAAAGRNANRGYKDSALFEVGLQFHDVTPDGQRMVAAGLRTGTLCDRRYPNGLFSEERRPVDAFDAKTDALAVLATLGVSKCDITRDTPAWYHPGRSGALTLGKTVLGHFGEIHPGLLPGFELEGSACAFEIFLDAIPPARIKGKARPPIKLSDFQAVERDFAFIVSEHVSAADIAKAIAQAEKQLITAVSIFDVYAGKGIEPGKKSVAVKVTLQAADRTLSEADINTACAAVVAAAGKAFGGQVRQ